MQRLAAVNVDDATLDVLDLAVREIVGRYEGEGPQRLACEVVRLRHLVEALLGGRQHPEERRRLYGLGGRLSGLLGYMAVNCGRFLLAGAYCEEALQLAAGLEDSDLRAWVRGTQSLAAYYMGRFDEALEFARAGQHAARSGPQAIRLAVNGEARALGRLGDRRGVDEAVDRAFLLAEVIPVPTGLTPCISFEPYSTARIAANAATAYLESATRHGYCSMPTRSRPWWRRRTRCGVGRWSALTRQPRCCARIVHRSSRPCSLVARP
jgi:hypothetical protein